MNRRVHIELLRILAIFLVVLNHTSVYGMPFHTGDCSALTFVMLVVSAFIKVAVPIFFMIAGALLIPKEESIMTLLRKRVLRFCLLIILFVGLQYAYYQTTKTADAPGIGITAFIHDLYCGSHKHSYVIHAAAIWFLYAYLGLLLVMPFLRLMAQRITHIHITYLIGLSVAVGFIMPLAYSLVTGQEPSHSGILERSPYMTGMGAYMLYAVVGYYIENKVDVNRVAWKTFFVLAAVSCLALIMEAASEFLIIQRTDVKMFDESILPFKGLTIIPCATIYLFVKKLFTGKELPMGINKWIGYVGAATFSVFLTEHILRQTLSNWFPEASCHYLASFTLAVTVTGIGIAIGLILKRIPVLKKLV